MEFGADDGGRCGDDGGIERRYEEGEEEGEEDEGEADAGAGW